MRLFGLLLLLAVLLLLLGPLGGGGGGGGELVPLVAQLTPRVYRVLLLLLQRRKSGNLLLNRSNVVKQGNGELHLILKKGVYSTEYT